MVGVEEEGVVMVVTGVGVVVEGEGNTTEVVAKVVAEVVVEVVMVMDFRVGTNNNSITITISNKGSRHNIYSRIHPVVEIWVTQPLEESNSVLKLMQNNCSCVNPAVCIQQ